MKIPESNDPPIGINIVPMIDIIFSILAFFIISTLYLTESEGLSVNLPSATTAQQQPSTKITVTVDEGGAVFLNKNPVAIPDLAPEIEALMATDGETLAIINADRGVNHGRVVEVMDQLRQVEGLRLAIATTPAE